ncbi:MAG: orotidine-5'-phosphate decarboxylase [Crocinitomicaceae bacterium]|nr:orotidine-5'-phosphate decarboxylase [Crocinitomicaceae bacterium]|tara:strand:- start:4615 stop:5316 length:702 start_codon:yes stop_codon:yes gene_type:complete
MEKFIKKGQIIVGLDFDNSQSALDIAELLNPENYKVKVGSQLFTACGPKILEDLNIKGFDIFLDLKYNDTPNTVEKAILEACKNNVWMTNIHLSGGQNMIDAAVNAKKSISSEILLIGVTVLTSLDQKDLYDIGVSKDLKDQIISLFNLGKKGGIDGIVCSPNDLAYLKKEEMDSFITVCPGIRVNAESGGQKRTATIHDAINMGADYLVVAREIISSSNPLRVINEIDSYFI